MSNLSLDEITKILKNSKVINPKDIPQIEKEKFQIQVNKALEEMSIQIKDKNDVSEKLNELSVSLTDDNGKYRSLGDILEDMSKKYNENIKNNKLEGENKMKYITPNVPNIKIETKEGKEILIDYVYETEIVTLNKKALILIEVPLSDTNMDELNHTDTYKMNLNFKTMDTMCKDLESKELDFENMELKLKLDTYATGCAERKIYAFYNGEGDAIYDVITSIIKYKYYQQEEEGTNNDLYFAKVRPSAKIPTKDDENMGYDIYADFEEDYMLILPHETKMIPTGICSACSEDYAIVLKERGSTGTKGIGQRCGVIDSGYRGEWFTPITNTTNYPIIISKITDETELLTKAYGKIAPVGTVIYPYTKAICQAVVLPVPKMNVQEISLEELKSIPSKRKEGKIGSSGK